MYQDNGKMVDSPFGCNGIQLNQTEKLQEDQDSPLDLTVTRIQEHSFQDGKEWMLNEQKHLLDSMLAEWHVTWHWTSGFIYTQGHCAQDVTVR